ncbi:aromatic/alkene monooxygenase hydroxylase subunit beta [Zhongshania marina]|uniref:Phenol hydroxylase n=1 Tax=Zhongshania marina TaxID=2304603 RepID=A0A2S4HKG7_9GAMM|nr:aromatic/alkene monooxygenase hydroxylase subunit beta [Marortus luteolus]POP54487.1 phenol hydroxylase [Marortus luteolus]
MAVEIKTSGVKPLRNTFDHLVARFGDKPANRYQEFSFDTQPATNFHYKPLWNPDSEVYDINASAIKMNDWYALKDPRQFYYGSYVSARAKQQEAIDQQLAFIDDIGSLSSLPEKAKNLLTEIIVALRHYEWGANTNNNFIAAYGYGTTITQAATIATCDRLAMAQHLSRIGLLIDEKTGESLDKAKRIWIESPAWQGIRKDIEGVFVLRDWFEVFVAQNLVADGLMYPLIFDEFVSSFSRNYGNDLNSLTNYSVKWQSDFARWVDSVVKTASSESDENKEQINKWIDKWHASIYSSLGDLAKLAFGIECDESLEKINSSFIARISKLGLR